MSWPPLDITAIRALVTTNVAANTVTTHTLLAAPGADWRYRVWGWAANSIQTTAAGTGFRALLITGATRDVIAFVGVSGRQHQLPASGIALLDNQALQIDSVCSAASQPLDLVAYYSRERAA